MKFYFLRRESNELSPVSSYASDLNLKYFLTYTIQTFSLKSSWLIHTVLIFEEVSKSKNCKFNLIEEEQKLLRAGHSQNREGH